MNRAIPTRAAACLALAAALILALAGCGDSDGDATTASKKDPASGSRYVDWPLFGRIPARTHYLPATSKALAPPLKQAWSINTHALIEFPPAIHDGIAYVINKYGNGKAVRLKDRKILWDLNVRPSDKGEPNMVTAPVYYRGRVYGAFLTGHLAAGDAETGRKVWVRKFPTQFESSPLTFGGMLYLGSNTAGLLALDAASGRVKWRFKAPGEIKASPSHHRGRVFAADYESSMFALDAKTGKEVWRTDTSEAPPYGSGGFFSSPAIAFGKVYAARDDGTVFAFDEKTGKVAWSFDTGDYVYGSPALAQVPGTPPTVYIGSESGNGRFFAIDARTGKERWHYDLGGPIPGTATVIGHTVYTSSFETKETVGLDVHTHKPVFRIKESGYTPMVSDGERLYLVGYYDLVGLEPRKR